MFRRSFGRSEASQQGQRCLRVVRIWHGNQFNLDLDAPNHQRTLNQLDRSGDVAVVYHSGTRYGNPDNNVRRSKEASHRCRCKGSVES